MFLQCGRSRHRRTRGESDGTSRRRRADFPSTRSRRTQGFVGQRRHLPLHHWGGDGIFEHWVGQRRVSRHAVPSQLVGRPSGQPAAVSCRVPPRRGPRRNQRLALLPQHPPGDQRRCRGSLVQKHRVGRRPLVGVSRQRLPPTRHDRHGKGGLPGADGFRRRRAARLGHRQQGAARGHRPNPGLRGVVPQRRFRESASLRQGERRLDSIVHVPN